jgi:hypothetical protein
MSPKTSDPVIDARRRLVNVAGVSAAVTLLFSWATWALFLADRSGEGSPERFVEDMATWLRQGSIDRVRQHLAPSFTWEPEGLDGEAALAIASREYAAGRLHPYVAFVHPIQDGSAADGATHWAAIGVLASSDPERKRDPGLRAMRLELELREEGGTFLVLRARRHSGR